MRKSIPVRRSATSSDDRSYCPDAGDLIWIDFHPQKGREQAGRRPAIVLSPRRYNDRAALCVVCPITSQVKNYPFEVALPEGGPISGGAVLADQVKSLSWETRNSAFAARAPASIVGEVKAKITALLQID